MQADTHGRKVLLIGVDGATWRLLDPWLERGELPVLRGLIDRGARRTLMSVIPAHTSVALASLFTGKNPGQHGWLEFVRPTGEPISLLGIKHRKFWEIAGDEGRTVALLYCRMTYPPAPVNGVVVSGHPVPRDAEVFTSPPEIADRFGLRETLALEDEAYHGENARIRAPVDESVDRRIEILRRQLRAFEALKAEQAFDLVFYYFDGADSLQHTYWDQPEALLRFYRELDTAIGRLLALLPDHTVLVFSDHGFGPSPTASFHVNTWLKEEGLLTVHANPVRRYLAIWAKHAARRLVPKIILARLVQRLSRRDATDPEGGDDVIIDRFRTLAPEVDWSRTLAYRACWWGIRVVEEGRSAAEIEDTVDTIIRRLRELRDPGGDPAVRAVWRREEVYVGPFVPKIPHVVFIPVEKYATDWHITSAVFGPLQGDAEREHARWTGTHAMHPEGVLIAAGPDIQPGRPEPEAKIVDLAPTLLHLMDCPIPDGVDGAVYTALFQPGSEPALRPVRYTSSAAEAEEVLTADEQAAIEERLESMGYL